MTQNRRDFLRTSTSVAAGGALAMGGILAPSVPPAEAHDRPPDPGPSGDLSEPNTRSLRILILGGTSFLGPHQVHLALERGHQVSIFTRGRTRPTVHVQDFQRVEHLVGDRQDDLTALEGREWDAVLDNSTSRWEWARDSARLLADSVNRYLFISSTGVYYPYLATDIDESVEPLTEDPSGGEDGSRAYGVMKARGENAVQEVFGSRAIIARPQHFTGPAERADRHGYWVERMERGGEILAMGRRDDPVMLMDVRDLAAFCIHLLETEAGGIFNVAGPASPLTQEEFLHGLRFCTGEEVTWTWVDDYDFLRQQGLVATVPWVMLEGNDRGYTRINIDKALSHGLKLRPLADTHRDTRAWWYSDAVSEERRSSPRFPLTPEEEARILAAWKERRGRNSR